MASQLDRVRRAAKNVGFQHLPAVGAHSYLLATHRLLDHSPLAIIATLIPGRQAGQVTMQFGVQGKLIWSARADVMELEGEVRKALINFEVLDFRWAHQ